jgi:hypothetical protein
LIVDDLKIEPIVGSWPAILDEKLKLNARFFRYFGRSFMLSSVPAVASRLGEEASFEATFSALVT